MIRTDIDWFFTFLKPGGVLAGHDFSLNHVQLLLGVLTKLAENVHVLPEKVTLHLGRDCIWCVFV